MQDALQLLDDLDRRIAKLDVAAAAGGGARCVAALLQTHPGVGPITALAFLADAGRDRALSRTAARWSAIWD